MSFPSGLTQLFTHQMVVVDVYRLILSVFHSDLTHIGLLLLSRLLRSTLIHFWRNIEVWLYFWVGATTEKTEEVSVSLWRDILGNVLFSFEVPLKQDRFKVGRTIFLLRMFWLLVDLTMALIRGRFRRIRRIGLQNNWFFKFFVLFWWIASTSLELQFFRLSFDHKIK